MQYPKFRFHSTEKEVIVTDPEHEDAVASDDAGWVNHPSELALAEPEDDSDLSQAQIDDSEAPAETAKGRKARLAKEAREAAKASK
jgi:hypothetical protein